MSLTLDSKEEALIVALRERLAKVQNYEDCVDAMAGAALDAFNLVAKALSVTGWQASCAELEFVRRSRGIDGPWGIYAMHDALYPQYDLVGRLEKMRHADTTVKWLGDCAEYALAVYGPQGAAPRVTAHWIKLVADRDQMNCNGSHSIEEIP